MPSLLRMSEVIKEELPNNKVAVLSGPTLAVEVLNGKPTAASIACENIEVAKELQKVISEADNEIYSRYRDAIKLELNPQNKKIVSDLVNDIESEIKYINKNPEYAELLSQYSKFHYGFAENGSNINRKEPIELQKLVDILRCNWLIKHNDSDISSLAEVLKSMNITIKKLEEEIEDLLPEQARKLTTITGIRTLTAAIIYTELKGKKMTKAQLASYSGVAPVECSSGLSSKFRNNKRGNRTLNSVLYSVSLHQSRFDKIGAEYFSKKLQEGKSKRHARKCLARQVSNLIWKALFAG